MKYLLDTNVCIRYINGRSAQIRTKLRAAARQDIAVSSVTKAELFYGSAKSQTPDESLRKQLEFLETIQSIPFDDVAAVMYGRLRGDLEKRRSVIGPNDLLIAATALAHNLIIVTHNTREFERVTGLQLEDWEL